MRNVIYNNNTGKIYTITNNAQDPTLMLSNWENSQYIQINDDHPIKSISMASWKIDVNTKELILNN